MGRVMMPHRASNPWPARCAVTLIVLALSAALFACGQAAEEPEPSSPAPTATATTPTTAPAPAPGAPGIEAPSEPVTSTYFTPTADLPRVRFQPSGAELPVEAPSREEYPVGLSGRYSLEGRGMLFAFPGSPNPPGFWMRNTHIDLDIAFVDEAGTIVAIRTMRAETEEIHHPGEHYLAAVEAPAGWFAEHSVAVGDTVEFPASVEALLAGE